MEGVEGKVVVIAGASSGIGEATAVELADAGAHLVLGARRADRLEELAVRLRSAGAEVLVAATDVRVRADLEHLVGLGVERWGRVDVLFSNAGAMSVSPLDDLRVNEWDLMVDVNLKGVLNGIAAALPQFRQQGFGQFVHTASTAAYKVVPEQAVYAATKTAVKVLTEGLRQEAGPDLRVTLVSPGSTNTEGVGKGGSPETAARLVAARDAIAMPPSAIARAVAFAIAQPPSIDVGEIVVRPTKQA